LTTHLAEARELEQSLLVDLGAHNDIRVLLGRRARRIDSSPTPTPKAA
jgi:hypothetical protein